MANMKDKKAAAEMHGLTLANFQAHLPDHTYICMVTGAFWSAAGVNACLQPIPLVDKDGKPVLITKGENAGKTKTVPATVMLDRQQPVHSLTWAPGHPTLIRNQLVAEGGWIRRLKVTTYNFYRPPPVEEGDAGKASPWLELVNKVYPDGGARLIEFLAHCVQHPGVKINHAVMLGGSPGIGKDTILEPVKYAVGSWNFREVSPSQLMGRFNGFLKAVIMRVNEVRDLGEFNRYQFYEHSKHYLASPPDTLRVDEKNTPEHEIINCVAVIFTTNHLTDGIYLPADDRRHYVLWSECAREDFKDGYWREIYRWYEEGGKQHVAAYLRSLDLSKFDPKEPPPKTPAFWAIVDANRAPEEGELADILDRLGNPDAITLDVVIDGAGGRPGPYSSDRGDIGNWLVDRKNRRIIPHRFENVGYVPVRDEANKSGLWVVGGKRQAVYAKKSLPAPRSRTRLPNCR